LILYFHGNSEDIGHNLEFLHHVSERFEASVFAMEYPGYGFFEYLIEDGKQKDKKLTCSTPLIKENSKFVYEHITKPTEQGGLGFKPENIIIYGRSIGTGPAIHLASICHPRGLILISAFTTITAVA